MTDKQNEVYEAVLKGRLAEYLGDSFADLDLGDCGDMIGDDLLKGDSQDDDTLQLKGDLILPIDDDSENQKPENNTKAIKQKSQRTTKRNYKELEEDDLTVRVKQTPQIQEKKPKIDPYISIDF